MNTKDAQVQEFYFSRYQSIMGHQSIHRSEDLINMITNSKLAYYRRIASKPNNPNSPPKTYWSILKPIVNGKKVVLIPPILVNDQLVINSLEKANLVNDFFTQQCSITENDVILPNDLVLETTEIFSYFLNIA